MLDNSKQSIAKTQKDDQQKYKCRRCQKKFNPNLFYAECQHQGICQTHIQQYFLDCLKRIQQPTCFEGGCDAKIRKGQNGFYNYFRSTTKDQYMKFQKQYGDGIRNSRIKLIYRCKQPDCIGELEKQKCKACSANHCLLCWQLEHTYGKCQKPKIQIPNRTLEMNKKRKQSKCCLIF